MSAAGSRWGSERLTANDSSHKRNKHATLSPGSDNGLVKRQPPHLAAPQEPNRVARQWRQSPLRGDKWEDGFVISVGGRGLVCRPLQCGNRLYAVRRRHGDASSFGGPRGRAFHRSRRCPAMSTPRPSPLTGTRRRPRNNRRSGKPRRVAHNSPFSSFQTAIIGK